MSTTRTFEALQQQTDEARALAQQVVAYSMAPEDQATPQQDAQTAEDAVAALFGLVAMVAAPLARAADTLAGIEAHLGELVHQARRRAMQP